MGGAGKDEIMNKRNEKQWKVTALLLFVLAALGCVWTDTKSEKPTAHTQTIAAEPARVSTEGAPKQVILLISDGMGFLHMKAADWYEAGPEGKAVYQDFPVQMAMATFMAGGNYEPEKAWADPDYIKENPTDSAAAVTAMATGVKTYKGAVNYSLEKEPLYLITEEAEERGKATGVVSSVPLSHATPAGFVAHHASRNNYAEIAREMFCQSPVDVIMGCGHPWYNGDGKPLEKASTFKYVGGEETWAALKEGTLEVADADGDGKADPWTFLEKRKDVQALAKTENTSKRVLAIPEVAQTLQQKRSGDDKAVPYAVPLTQTVPTLEEMTRAALNVLDNDPDGFFLMVEGGAVDWASHENQLGRAIEEQIDFNRAVDAVVEWVEKNSSWEETLVIVTADHECGYLANSEGIAREPEPSAQGILPAMTWQGNYHTNSLVPFYAKGPGSAIFATQAAGTDPMRGDYLDNTLLAKALFALWRESAEE